MSIFLYQREQLLPLFDGPMALRTPSAAPLMWQKHLPRRADGVHLTE
jgi:hypothetical protein